MKSTIRRSRTTRSSRGEQPVHGLAHPRRRGGVHLALHAHDSHPAEIFDRHVEWMWANPSGQSESLAANIHRLGSGRD